MGSCWFCFCEWYRVGIYMDTFISADQEICSLISLANIFPKSRWNYSTFLGITTSSFRGFFERQASTLFWHRRNTVPLYSCFCESQLD